MGATPSSHLASLIDSVSTEGCAPLHHLLLLLQQDDRQRN
uniref:Uncharacterized protein n=1 Tax=Arundo donax TaxID=35708 RepID=A0A0A9BFP6_ARUDO